MISTGNPKSSHGNRNNTVSQDIEDCDSGRLKLSNNEDLTQRMDSRVLFTSRQDPSIKPLGAMASTQRPIQSTRESMNPATTRRENFNENTLQIGLDSIMTEQLAVPMSDPQTIKFEKQVDQKIKTFKTLKQLNDTLVRQTPRIQSRVE